MKTSSHICKKIITLLVCTLLLAACRKEDSSMCLDEVQVYFTFTFTIASETANYADIKNINLYVFDDKGYFVTEYIDNNISNFSADYYISCTGLQPGNYRFIAWGGKDDRYYYTTPAPFVKGQTTFNEALLMLEHAGNTISTTIPHIFHSDISATVVPYENIQRFYMPLVQHSNTINIYTVGLRANTNVYTFNIIDNNCAYKFDRSFASHSHAAFTYTAPCTKDGASQLYSTLNVLRLSANRRVPQLQILNSTTGAPLYPVGTQSGNLIELILNAYPQNNFETTNVYDIVFAFTYNGDCNCDDCDCNCNCNPDPDCNCDCNGNGNNGDGSTNINVTITINGWQVREQGDDLIW